MDELMQQVFDNAYDDAYESFRLRRQTDETFTKDYLQGLLQSLYVRQGNNWDGRGQTKDMEQSAMIAAAETTLIEWDRFPLA